MLRGHSERERSAAENTAERESRERRGPHTRIHTVVRIVCVSSEQFLLLLALLLLQTAIMDTYNKEYTVVYAVYSVYIYSIQQD